MSLTQSLTRPIPGRLARAINSAAAVGGRIPQPGDYLLTAAPPSGDHLTDESGNRLTA